MSTKNEAATVKPVHLKKPVRPTGVMKGEVADKAAWYGAMKQLGAKTSAQLIIEYCAETGREHLITEKIRETASAHLRRKVAHELPAYIPELVLWVVEKSWETGNFQVK